VEKSTAEAIERDVRSAFPAGTIARVQVLEYGDDPSVEPSETAVRVFIDRGARPEGEDGDGEIVQGFEQENRAAVRKLRDVLPPFVRWMEFRADTPTGAGKSRGPILKLKVRQGRGAAPEGDVEELTPVMTRLGPQDLATVDTLINAGFANSRAEVLRWALGRVREHPAYAQLQERVHEIGDLKAQF
jgi:hypothetical protein